jgi:pyruvate formate lyase activating enzyme
MTRATILRDILAEHVARGVLYEPMSHDWVRCVACAHRCKIAPQQDGICKVRFNRRGVLYVPNGYVAGMQVDPIEKKPFFHVVPGAPTLSFGMLGCDYHCAYCQNWITSQALRDPEAGSTPNMTSAEQIVGIALEQNIPVITSTYNEPLITSEWAVEIFKIANSYGIKCAFVSNGNATPEVLDFIKPYVQFYKIDLKSFRQKHYQQLGGTLTAVIETIRALHRMNIWVEIVTLVIPGFNDADDELKEMAQFLVSVSPDIPWHVTAFHQDYEMKAHANTPSATLMRAAEIGYGEGLHFVYAGNSSGNVGKLENTYCYTCGELLIERHGFTVSHNRMNSGTCPRCRTTIPGVWGPPETKAFPPSIDTQSFSEPN